MGLCRLKLSCRYRCGRTVPPKVSEEYAIWEEIKAKIEVYEEECDAYRINYQRYRRSLFETTKWVVEHPQEGKKYLSEGYTQYPLHKSHLKGFPDGGPEPYKNQKGGAIERGNVVTYNKQTEEYEVTYIKPPTKGTLRGSPAQESAPEGFMGLKKWGGNTSANSDASLQRRFSHTLAKEQRGLYEDEEDDNGD